MPKAIPLNAHENNCSKVYASKIHLYDLTAAGFHLKVEMPDVVSAARENRLSRLQVVAFHVEIALKPKPWSFKKICPSKFLSCTCVTAQQSQSGVGGAVGTEA